MKLPKTLSRREAMHRVHHSFTAWFHRLHVMALQEHVQSLQPDTQKSVFYHLVNAWEKEGPTTTLELQDGITTVPNCKLAQECADEV